MTLPSVGTTSDAQAANVSGAATSSSTGAITFVGPQGIQGSTITCVVTVPGAPANAIFTATLGTIGGQGVVVGTWGGTSTGGRFQIGVGQTLTVAGTGLAPATAYTCTFAQVIDVGTAEVVVPEPNFSALLATLAGAGLAGTSLLGANAVIAPGAGDNIIALGTGVGFQLWNWGWTLPFSETAPTAGSAEISLAPMGVADSLSWQEGASNRIAGAKSTNSITIVNFFNTQVYFFVVYSLA